MVQSGIDCLYSRGNVWSPVISAVKANSPLPNDNGDSEFNWCRVGLCLSTRARRLMIAAALAPEPAKRLAPRANAAAPMAVARKSLRETVIVRGVNYGVRRFGDWSAGVRAGLSASEPAECKRGRLRSSLPSSLRSGGALQKDHRISAEAVQSRGD